MAHSSKPDLDPESSSSSGSSGEAPDPHAREWSALYDLLNVQSPSEVVAQVRALAEPAEAGGPADSSSAPSLISISEVEEVFQEMHQKVETLRKRNAALVDRLEEQDGDGTQSAYKELYQATEHLLDTLGATGIDEARDRVQRLNRQLDELSREKERLAEAGYASAEEVLDELEALRSQASGTDGGDASESRASASDARTSDARDLKAENDRLQAERSRLQRKVEQLEHKVAQLREAQSAPSSGGLDTSVLEAASAVKQIIGVRSLDEAHRFAATVETLYHRLQRLVASLEPETEDDAAAPASPDDVVEMIHHMDRQISKLQKHLEGRSSESASPPQNARQQLSAVEDVLGIRSREGAEKLAKTLRSMEAQLDDLYDDKKELEAVGLSSAEDAIDMISSMRDQLVELYEDRESVQALGDSSDEAQQDTFEQLQSLYAERETLKRELGVADAGAIIEMVEGLSTQLEELYEERDADASEQADVPRPETVDPESVSAGGNGKTDPSPTASNAPSSPAPNAMVASMRQQLEALYEEKYALLDRGMGDVREALSQIDRLREQIQALNEQNRTYEERFERLSAELGTSDVDQLIDQMRTLQKSPATDEAHRSSDASPDSLVIDAAPAFVDDETLRRLEDMDSDERNALDVGVLRLTDQGVIESINDTGLELPGPLSDHSRTELMGENFFLDVAPSADNKLFFGRFKQGVQRGAMEARFPYTFTRPGRGPTVLIVHLHRKRARGVNWLLFRPL